MFEVDHEPNPKVSSEITIYILFIFLQTVILILAYVK